MYWSWTYNNKNYISWGEPRLIDKISISNLKPRFDIKIYSGQQIKPEESVVFTFQGSSDLGLGDSIWLCSYLRDIYRIKARRKCNFNIVSSPWVHNFYKNFLPSSFNYINEYMLEEDFMRMEHKLPAMYYWHEEVENSKKGTDKSWVDNKSIIQRLYSWTGMEYNGLPDWGEFTNEKILYPKDDFYSSLNLNKKDKYVYFQWHSSGHAKNLPPASNIKLLKHITKNYGLKVYVIGRLKCLDVLNEIDGVVNLSGKTEGNVESLFSLAFNSEFIVCPDSAGVHMAEAFKIPAVCILSTLPPSYICSKYKIPTFMYGSGKCPFKPCGIVHELPKENRCPVNTKDYCAVLEDIDVNLFDKCVTKSFENRLNYKSTKPENFYDALSAPISL